MSETILQRGLTESAKHTKDNKASCRENTIFGRQ